MRRFIWLWAGNEFFRDDSIVVFLFLGSRNTNGTEFQGANSAGTAGSIQSKLIEVQPFFFHNQRSLSNLFNGRPNILTNNSKEKQLNTTKKKNSRR